VHYGFYTVNVYRLRLGIWRELDAGYGGTPLNGGHRWRKFVNTIRVLGVITLVARFLIVLLVLCRSAVCSEVVIFLLLVGLLVLCVLCFRSI
jgi:hypothetical protein